MFNAGVVFMLALAAAGLATPQESAKTDPPRRAARLGYVAGNVSFQPAGLTNATPAELNRPFSSGDRFWTGPDGRGELQTENAAMRFSGNTRLVIDELSNDATQVTVTSGILNVRLHTLAPRESFEVDTPEFSFGLTKIGQYRIEVPDKGTALLTVRLGEAEAFKGNGGAPEPVHQGRQAQTAGGKVEQHSVPALDNFDNWCIDRDQREDLSLSARYVSRDVPGYAELDHDGDWRTIDHYGPVWFPSNLDADWAPDRYGHFVQVDPWNMHWVDEKRWGFAPSHYGRWNKFNGEWGWIPPGPGKSPGSGTGSQFAIRPYYAPALVAWTKFAPGAAAAGEVVGWFPLGPGEPWKPDVETSPAYVQRVNMSNTAIDKAVFENPEARVDYVNRQVALTAVPSGDLAAGRPVGKQFVHVPETALALGVVSAASGIIATREARIGPLGQAPEPPPEIANRAVAAHRVVTPRFTPTLSQQGAASPFKPGSLAVSHMQNLRQGTPVAHQGGLMGAFKKATALAKKKPAVVPKPKSTPKPKKTS